MPDGDITTREALEDHYGQPKGHLSRKELPKLNEHSRHFIALSPFLVLSTSAANDGPADASPRGDAPGFVQVLDDTTIAIPDRPGNKLAFGLKNILENPQVGLLFLMPGTPETLRINGRAEIHAGMEIREKLSARTRPAVVAIRVAVEECFFHCAKAFKRSELWKPDTWPDRYRISFGELLAPKMGGGPAEAKAIDDMVEQDYRDGL